MFAAFIVRRKGTPQEWHQLVDRRDSELQADFAIRAALDMSGETFGYITRSGVPIRFYGRSNEGHSAALRPVGQATRAPTTPAGTTAAKERDVPGVAPFLALKRVTMPEFESTIDAMDGSIRNWRANGKVNAIYAPWARRQLQRLRRSPDIAVQQRASALLVELNAMIRAVPRDLMFLVDRD
jgi:hypothetical protein